MNSWVDLDTAVWVDRMCTKLYISVVLWQMHKLPTVAFDLGVSCTAVRQVMKLDHCDLRRSSTYQQTICNPLYLRQLSGNVEYTIVKIFHCSIVHWRQHMTWKHTLHCYYMTSAQLLSKHNKVGYPSTVSDIKQSEYVWLRYINPLMSPHNHVICSCLLFATTTNYHIAM